MLLPVIIVWWDTRNMVVSLQALHFISEVSVSSLVIFYKKYDSLHIFMSY